MNTLEEILKSKNLYEYYAQKLCINCANRYNDKDLCKITMRTNGSVKCENYERCMTNKCKSCDKEKKCFKEEKKNESKSDK